MRWLITIAALFLGSAGAASPPAPASLLLKPAGVFDGVDGKVHAGWQVLVTGDTIRRVGPAVPAPAGVDQHDGRAAAARVSGHGDQRARVGGIARGEPFGVPGDFRGGVPKKIGIGVDRPDAIHGRGIDTG